MKPLFLQLPHIKGAPMKEHSSDPELQKLYTLRLKLVKEGKSIKEVNAKINHYRTKKRDMERKNKQVIQMF